MVIKGNPKKMKEQSLTQKIIRLLNLFASVISYKQPERERERETFFPLWAECTAFYFIIWSIQTIGFFIFWSIHFLCQYI